MYLCFAEEAERAVLTVRGIGWVFDCYAEPPLLFANCISSTVASELLRHDIVMLDPLSSSGIRGEVPWHRHWHRRTLPRRGMLLHGAFLSEGFRS
jgi:hypothetical protein